MPEYSHGQGNPLSGQHGSYPEFIRDSSPPRRRLGSQDYMIANVILMPVFTIIDGYRRGLRRPWLFFLSSLFTSFAFPFAFYFATIERQRRHAESSSAATTDRRLGADSVGAGVGFVVGEKLQRRRKRPFVVAGLVATTSFGDIHCVVGCRDQLEK